MSESNFTTIVNAIIAGFGPYRIIFLVLGVLCGIRFIADTFGSMRRRKESKSVLLTFSPDGTRIQNAYRIPYLRLAAEAVAAVAMAVLFAVLG